MRYYNSSIGLIFLHHIIFISIFIQFDQNVFAHAESRSIRKRNKEFVIAVDSLPTNLNPAQFRLTEHVLILKAISNTLVKVTNSGLISSDLAERWTIGKDMRTFDFFLRRGIRDHAGKEVDANYVRNVYGKHFKRNGRSSSSECLRGVIAESSEGDMELKGWNAIEVVGKYQLRFNLERPYLHFMHCLSLFGFGVATYNREFGLVGTGPFKLIRQEKTEFILEKNPDYFGSNPEMNRIYIKGIKNVEQIKGWLEDGRIDAVFSPSIDQIHKRKFGKGYKVDRIDVASFVHMYFNIRRHKIFENKDFRRDFSAMIKNIFRDVSHEVKHYLEPVDTLLPKGLLPFSYYNKKPNFINTQEFKKKWGSDIRDVHLVVPLLERVFLESHSVRLKELFKTIGFPNPKVMLVDTDALMNILETKNYDLVGGRFTGNLPDVDGYLKIIDSRSSLHYGEFDDEDYFDDLSRWRFSLDSDARASAYSKIMTDFESQYFWIPLFRFRTPIILHDDLNFPDVSFRQEGEIWRMTWK